MKKLLKFGLVIAGAFLLAFFNLLNLPPKAQAYSWNQVNDNGFGDAANILISQLYVYNGYIYAAGGNAATGAFAYRSSNGTTWEAVTLDGFSDANNLELHDFVSFNGFLYVATVKDLLGVEGAEVWRSSTGGSGTWSQANIDGFEDLTNTGIETLATFDGYLYAGTFNLATGTEIWRTANGTTWEQVNSDGFGTIDGVTRIMKVYNNQLYVGTCGPVIGDIWGKIFRTSGGSSWTTITNNGFANTNNACISMLESFNGNLYAGTLNDTDGGELWRSASGDAASWSQVGLSGFGDATNIWMGHHGAIVNGEFLIGTRKLAAGAELWKSTDGSNWTQESTDGFDDPNNFALYAQTFKNYIYVGFTNSTTGAEIWRSELQATLSIANSSLPNGTVGTPYSVTLMTNNGTPPFAYTLTGNLPPGLSLSSSGVISGTPERQGEYTFTINVSDAGTPTQTDSKNFAITVSIELPETGGNSLF